MRLLERFPGLLRQTAALVCLILITSAVLVLVDGDLGVRALWRASIVAAAVIVTTLATRWVVERGIDRGWRESAAFLRLRRENALLEVARDLLATLDRQAAYETAIKTARSELAAQAALIEMESCRTICGDDGVVAHMMNPAPAPSPEEPAAETPVPLLGLASSLCAATIENDVVLAVYRDDPPLDEVECAWLMRLAALLRSAIEKSAQYQQLQHAEQRLRAGADSAPAPLAIWGPDGAPVLINEAYRDLGVSNAQSAGSLSLAGGHEGGEIVVGDPARTFVALTAAVDGTGDRVSILREVTQERAALRAKDDLIAMAGHELRSPLTSISGYSQIMARQLTVVQRQIAQINDLIGDFLEAAELEGNRLRLASRLVDVGELARMSAERFQGSNEKRTLKLDVGNAPQVEGDPTRLAQVFDNLLSNAAKYSDEDQEIVLTVKADERQVLVSVRDRGVGIAQGDLSRLFDRFYRVRNAETEKVKGLGLGLAIVRDIVLAHGGRVWAESPGQGQGSTFWVSLPVPRIEDLAHRLDPTGIED